jgi:hypothetical protein
MKLVFMLFSPRACCLNMTAFCDIAPSSLVEIYRRLRGANCVHGQADDREGALIMKAASTSQKSIMFLPD